MQCCHTDPQYAPNTVIAEVQVASGWRGWWLEPRYPDFPPICPNCTSWHRPEWREAAPFSNRIRSGANSQKYFTFYSVHKAGMYQQVTGVPSGARLRFSVYMHAWSTTGSSLASTVRDNDVDMRVGIDPFGGTDAFSSRVIWSAPFNAWDNWQLYSVEAVAQSGTVTVFTHSQPRWGMEHNDIYVDDASLVVVDGSLPPAPAPTTAPTSAPAATSVPPTPAPPAPAPAAPAAPTFTTYVVQRGDSLVGIARKFGTTSTVLQRLNTITNPSRIFAGQVLRIPGAGSAPAAPSTGAPSSAPPAAPPANAGQAATYVIQRGDRLINVARKFNVSLAAVLAVNPGLDANRIFAGQTINLPPTQATRSYTVQRGETLRIIAERFGTTVAVLQALNNLSNPNLLFVGQVLLVP
jgi:LysM repeat protein